LTLTVCLKGTDGIVIAADSRATFGDPRSVTVQNDTVKKIYLVRNVGISQSGVPQANILVDEVKRSPESNGLAGVTDTMQIVRRVASTKFDEWY
jgi:20S proteasome alpha/beta subunit